MLAPFTHVITADDIKWLSGIEVNLTLTKIADVELCLQYKGKPLTYLYTECITNHEKQNTLVKLRFGTNLYLRETTRFAKGLDK